MFLAYVTRDYTIRKRKMEEKTRNSPQSRAHTQEYLLNSNSVNSVSGGYEDHEKTSRRLQFLIRIKFKLRVFNILPGSHTFLPSYSLINF